MSSAKVALAAVAVAMSLSACGVASKPEAGSAQAATKSHQQQHQTDPRTKHVKCLAQHHVAYRLETVDTHPSVQVGTRPTGPFTEFLATPGAAQYAQITGQAQGAEVIGSALVYPYQAPNRLMAIVEKCMSLGVTG
jgi:hypothetical protein